MRTLATSLVGCLLGCGEPRAAGRASESPAVIPVASAVASSHPDPSTCQCDIIGFESEGAPKSRCRMVVHADGTADLVGETSSPTFTAKLTPVHHASKRAAVDYVFEGEFAFACKSEWCQPTNLKVLEVREHDYRVTVERSAEGPPSRVLWLTCP